MRRLPTEPEVARQHERGRDGRYSGMSACELCRTPLGVEYFSLGNAGLTTSPLGPYGLTLCRPCCASLEHLPEELAAEALALARKRPFPKAILRGRFYLDNSCESGVWDEPARVELVWQVVDSRWGGTIGHGSKTWAEGVARFSRDYVKRWGDINFYSFPYDIEERPVMVLHCPNCPGTHYIAADVCPETGATLVRVY